MNVSFIKFNTPVLTRFWIWLASYKIFDIYFPECLFSKVCKSDNRIYFVIFFCNSAATSLPILIIINLAKYSERPFPEKAKIIKKGITMVKNLSCSTKIFFTAGSNSQAIDEVLPATIIDSIKDKKIFLICFLTYSL